nr:GRIP domain-containing protein C119.12-like [Aegilops tauschii subsp. strangulata]
MALNTEPTHNLWACSVLRQVVKSGEAILTNTTSEKHSSEDDDLNRACKLGSHYVALEKEVISLQLDLDIEKLKSARLEKEKKTLGETMKRALESKKDLAVAQKEARTKTKLTNEKLASVRKLEEEIKDVKAAVAAAKGESSEWEKKCKDQADTFAQEKQTLEEKVAPLTEKKNSLEQYIEDFRTEQKHCYNIELELERLERNLEPSRSLVADKAALAILCLEDHLENALGSITWTRSALGRIDKELQPCEETQMDLESIMTHPNEVPARVKAWKKSAARSDADVALSLVRVHCKNMDE